jgi:hypothetical protein
MISKQHPVVQLLYRKTGHLKLRDIYRVYLGKRQGQHVWIVDGARVCQIYPAFIMGGNDQRYRFNPPNEIWIDNRMGVDELNYTLAHELIERKLMREKGWSYDRAHSEGGLALEGPLRRRDQERVAARERKLPPVMLGEWEEELPADKKDVRVCLHGVYRSFYDRKGGMAIWIVDGTKVRRDLDGDFCFAGNDKLYRFVPPGEIWVDAAISVEELPFTIHHELWLRKLMAQGKSYGDAYEIALAKQMDERDRQSRLASRHEARLAPVRYGVRERGARV